MTQPSISAIAGPGGAPMQIGSKASVGCISRLQHFVSISGGKDSLATALLARERADRTGMHLRLINADLGANEHQITHDYIGYLETALGLPIQRVRADFAAEFAARRDTIQHHWSREKRRKEHTPGCKARAQMLPPIVSNCRPSRERVAALKEWRRLCDCRERVSPPVPQPIIDRAKELLVPSGEPFLDLCMLKGRFPSRTAQFCTERLKLEPINAITHPLLESGTSIVSWLGERAEESPKRAAKPVLDRIRWQSGASLIRYRPIHGWSAADVFALAKRHGIKPNALYLMGMGRVGCMPCVNGSKDELAQIDRRFPEVIVRLAEWERIVALVSRRGEATFFPAPMVPGDENDFTRANILAAVEWARTSRGGKQFDLMQALAATIHEEDGAMCESAYGLCE